MVARAALLLCLAAASTTYAANADPVQCVKDLEDVVRDIGASFSDIGELVTHCKEKDSALCVQAIETYTDSLNELVDAVDKTGVDCGVESVECAADIDKAAAGLDEAIDNIAKAAENCKTSKFQCVVDLEHVGKGLEEALHGIFSARTSCKKAKKVKKAVKVDPEACIKDLETATHDASVFFRDIKTVVTTCKEHDEDTCTAAIDTLADAAQELVDEVDQAGEDCGYESEACAASVDKAAAGLDSAVKDLGKAAENCKKGGSKFQCVVDLEETAKDVETAFEGIISARTDCKKAKKVKKVKKASQGRPQGLH
eukprot:TRINITY_DN101_c0_g2_i6.p2 TRINITY_DN101_c0_g2~~TRINITY_DN101_c0_g2_i6.p2  ORF type:complete len:312 (+),score=150.35 TRINITY_DN101_c0_g2_i6:63-998(+)